jgi:hypothetical protein
MTYKHLTFWSLVDRLDDHKRCYYKSFNEFGNPSINPRKMEIGMVIASNLCPGVSVLYDHNMPVKFSLWWEHRGYTKQFGSLWMTSDGRTVVRYHVPTVTGSEIYADKFVDLHRWLRGGGPCPAKKYEAVLPTHLASHPTRTSVAIFLDDDGEVLTGAHSTGGEAAPFNDQTASYFANGVCDRQFHKAGNTRIATLNPLLRCWDWWTPAKRAFGAVAFVRRECSQFGRLWVRPYLVTGGREWQAGVSVCHANGNNNSMFIGKDSTIADNEKEKERIVSWAMSNVEVPGPMSC